MYCNVTLKRLRATTVTFGNNTYYVIWVCVFVVLGLQHAIQIPRIVICDLFSCTIFFPILSHKRQEFRESLLSIKCVFWFPLQIRLQYLSFWEEMYEIWLKSECWSLCKMSVIIFRFWWNLNFLDRFSKKYLHIKCHKNPSSGSRIVLRAQSDGQTWRSL